MKAASNSEQIARLSNDTELVFTFSSLDAWTFSLWEKLLDVDLVEEAWTKRKLPDFFTVRLDDSSDDASLDMDSLSCDSELTSVDDESYLQEEIY